MHSVACTEEWVQEILAKIKIKKSPLFKACSEI